jgi:hypothetical protein
MVVTRPPCLPRQELGGRGAILGRPGIRRGRSEASRPFHPAPSSRYNRGGCLILSRRGLTLSSEKKEKSRSLYWTLAVLALLPLLYGLSIGPVAAICHRTGGNVEMVRVVYFPVILLHDQTPLRRPLEWYMRLWGVD